MPSNPTVTPLDRRTLASKITRRFLKLDAHTKLSKSRAGQLQLIENAIAYSLEFNSLESLYREHAAKTEEKTLWLVKGTAVLAAFLVLLLVGIWHFQSNSRLSYLSTIFDLSVAFLFPIVAVIGAILAGKSPLNPEIQRLETELTSLTAKVITRILDSEAHWMQLDGLAFERNVARVLKTAGYIVNLTPGSADGGIDIFAIRGGEHFAVQCKAHTSPIGPAPIRELYGVLNSALAGGSFIGVLISRSGFSEGAKNYARQVGIRLYDLTFLLELESAFGK